MQSFGQILDKPTILVKSFIRLSVLISCLDGEFIWRLLSDLGTMDERGGFLEFDSSLFSTVAIFIGIAIIIGCIAVLTLGLSFCLSSNIVFMACGWLMTASGKTSL